MKTNLGKDVDESFVHKTMIFKPAQDLFYQMWKGLIQYAMLKERLLGYKENTVVYDYEPLGRLHIGTRCPQQLLYVTMELILICARDK